MADFCPCCMAQIDSESSGKCPACGAEMTCENRPHQLPVMTILRGRYLVGRVLGEGGFGITYIGRDLVLNQRVAIKEYYPSGSATRHSTISLAVRSISQADDAIIEKGRSGFLKEAQAIARFHDVPSVVNVNDFFMENGTSYIVMEYLDGQSLQQRLKEKGPVRDFDTLYAMLRPVMEGLEKVHQAGIIHRDISPSNLMTNAGGEIKILDFGTARGFGQENEKSLSVVLKPGFAPVEQYRKHGKQGPWTDVYALCATIYKLLTGVTPESSVDRIMEDTLKPPSALGAKIAPKQEKALMAGLAVDPDKRTRSVAQLVKELDAGSKKKREIYCPNCMAKLIRGEETRCPVCNANLTHENLSHQLPVMTMLQGRYLVGRVLDEEWVEISYTGYDTLLGQRVVISEYFPHRYVWRDNEIPLKVKNEYQSDFEKGCSAFLERAHTITRFRNVPGIVKVNEVFTENGTGYIVQEYTDGIRLSQWLKEKGPVRDFDALYKMLRPVMDALEKVHDAGIIHCDIRPSNITINKNGEIKILFPSNPDLNYILNLPSSWGPSEVFMFAYTPVELHRKHGKQGSWTDVYSMCDTMYKLLTGVTPESSVDRMVEDTLKPPSALGAVISPEQERALMAGLAVEPEKRIKSFTELKRAFDACSKKKIIKEPKIKADADNNEASQAKGKKKKFFVLLSLAAAAIVLCVLFFMPGKESGKENEPVSPSVPTAMKAETVRHGFVQVSVSSGHIAALCADGYVHTLGNNYNGEAETGHWSDVVKVVTNPFTTYGLKADGTVLATKAGDYARNWENVMDIVSKSLLAFGLKSDGTVISDIDLTGTGAETWKNMTMIANGQCCLLGLTPSGTVVFAKYEIGKERYNDCGQDNVGDWTEITAIDAGVDYSVGLKADGTVVAVGRNNEGQCDVSSWNDITAISTGDYHTVGLKADGTVVAVGSNNYGECNVSEWRDVVSISAGKFATVALTSDGRILATGWNSRGELDVDKIECNHDAHRADNLTPTSTPMPVPTRAPLKNAESGFVQASIGDFHTAALCSKGYVHTGGSDEYGQCDTKDWSDIVKVSTGRITTYGLRADGTVVCTRDDDLSDWKDIVDIDSHSGLLVGLRADGTVACLEDDYKPNSEIFKGVTMISAGTSHLIGLTRSGTVVCELFPRFQEYGQTDVADWENIVSVCAGSYHSVGLKEDGTVIAAGSNTSGQCKVSDWEDIIAISAGMYHTVGLKADGTVVAAGSNSGGQCEVSEWRDVVSISAGLYSTVAVTSDGKILYAGPKSFNGIVISPEGFVCNH